MPRNADYPDSRGNAVNSSGEKFSMAQDNILALIDIGSAETKAIIADLEPQLKISGAFCAKTEGMRKGEIINLGALKESVHAVILAAERQANVRVRSACLAVSGAAVGGFSVSGLTSVKSGVVSKEDKASARDDAFSACLHRVPEGRHIVSRLRRRYLLDKRELEEPLGKSGRELTYDMWVADADDAYLTELYQIPNRYGMAVKGLFPASLASAESVRSFSEMDKNRLVIDIGAGTSDFALFRDGAVVLTGVIPVGGDHVTNDISCGLQIRAEDAERLKLRHGYAFARDESVLAEIDLDSFEGELKEFSAHVSRYKMELITEARLRELFMLIAKKIYAAESDFSGTVFLTGGTSQMNGIGQLARAVFNNAEVRLAEPNQSFAPEYTDPKYATVVGLAILYRDMLARERRGSGKIGRLRRFFGGMFK